MKKSTKISFLVVFLAVVVFWAVYSYTKEKKPAIGILEVEGGIMSAEPYLDTIKSF